MLSRALPARALVYFAFLLCIVLVKRIAAFGAELRGMLRVFRLPAALVALIYGCARRSRLSAFGAEFTLVYSAARARPALLLHGLGLGTFGAEFARINRAA